MAPTHVTTDARCGLRAKRQRRVCRSTDQRVVQNLHITCVEDEAVTRERLETWTVWTLAVILPGGLAILALWLSTRAARKRALLAGADRISHVSHAVGG